MRCHHGWESSWALEKQDTWGHTSMARQQNASISFHDEADSIEHPTTRTRAMIDHVPSYQIGNDFYCWGRAETIASPSDHLFHELCNLRNAHQLSPLHLSPRSVAFVQAAWLAHQCGQSVEDVQGQQEKLESQKKEIPIASCCFFHVLYPKNNKHQ